MWRSSPGGVLLGMKGGMVTIRGRHCRHRGSHGTRGLEATVCPGRTRFAVSHPDLLPLWRVQKLNISGALNRVVGRHAFGMPGKLWTIPVAQSVLGDPHPRCSGTSGKF